MRKAKLTIVDHGGDWCTVVLHGEPVFRGHLSDFQYEMTYFLRKWGILDIDEVNLAEESE